MLQYVANEMYNYIYYASLVSKCNLAKCIHEHTRIRYV